MMLRFFELFIDSLLLFMFAYFSAYVIYDKRKKNILSLSISLLFFSLILALLNCTDIEIFYGILKVLCTYILMCLFLFYNFKKENSKDMVMALIYYLCIFSSEVITVIIASYILKLMNSSISLMKYNLLLNFVITNLSFFIILIFRVKFRQIIHNINFKFKTDFVIIIILITMALLVFKIPLNKWDFNIDFIVTMLILLSFCIVAIYLFKQKSEVNRTSSMYHQVVKYSNTTNKLLEDYRIVSHEHQNQLSIIRQMVDNDNNKQELIEYLDNLLDKRNVIKYKWISDLNHIPLDGLKGLINYKLIEIEDDNINSFISISKEVSKAKLNKLSTVQKDNLYSVVGVYLDNAIQAAKEAKIKEFSLQIYKEHKDIVFIFGNTYKGKIDFDRIDNYGYSTKGKNHGIGLHIVKTILDSNDIFSQSRKIVDNYYIQELRIHIDLLKKSKK